MARLHYLLHDIEVPLGTFFIGRGADCQLALDDAMISRRHAALRIYAGSAAIEDLGSRNGVFLNGVRIDRTEPLRDGDHIRIGSQDLTFYENDDAHPLNGDRATKPTRREMQLTELREDDVSEQTYVATGPMAATVRAASGLAIIGGVADKALALGRAEEAERILQRSLADILTRATAWAGGAAPRPPGPGGGGDSQPPASAGEVDLELAERAAAYAVRLAAGTGHGAWVDYTFRLYTALGALLPARIVDELYAAVRKVKHTDRAVLRAYTTRLREISPGFGPAERFVLQRIEGFERWAP